MPFIFVVKNISVNWNNFTFIQAVYPVDFVKQIENDLSLIYPVSCQEKPIKKLSKQ